MLFCLNIKLIVYDDMFVKDQNLFRCKKTFYSCVVVKVSDLCTFQDPQPPSNFEGQGPMCPGCLASTYQNLKCVIEKVTCVISLDVLFLNDLHIAIVCHQTLSCSRAARGRPLF